jgi:hypothetical protein
VISGYEGSKPRQVLVSEAELPRMLERLDADPGTDDSGEQPDPGSTAELERLSG